MNKKLAAVLKNAKFMVLVGALATLAISCTGGGGAGGESTPPVTSPAPVAGLPAADSGDLHGVVPAAVPWVRQVRAVARELPTGGLVGAAAPLEYDVPLGVHAFLQVEEMSL